MLNDEEQAGIRQALMALRVELNAFRAASREGAKPVDLDQPIGRLTRIDAIQQQVLTQANRRRNEIRLQQVQAALHRLEAGSYGECTLCEEAIELDRLRARPEAPICLHCRQAVEAGD